MANPKKLGSTASTPKVDTDGMTEQELDAYIKLNAWRLGKEKMPDPKPRGQPVSSRAKRRPGRIDTSNH